MDPLGQDMLGHNWPNLQLYSFPPMPLLHMAMQCSQPASSFTDKLILAEQTMVPPVVNVTHRLFLLAIYQTGPAIPDKWVTVAQQTTDAASDPTILTCLQGSGELL